ncbi:hypothetical protein V0288_12895 [Pannus brasiliensis CCIBt3594]|uniref:Uncharacterized protein n=1 Tax=Pannus brasiliensis CCIBt3594 TaxID=1427578 RepID=A0AAW9QWF9_9CHRO
MVGYSRYSIAGARVRSLRPVWLEGYFLYYLDKHEDRLRRFHSRSSDR